MEQQNCPISMATDELDIADELSAISMTEEGQRQILEELENLEHYSYFFSKEGKIKEYQIRRRVLKALKTQTNRTL